MKYTHINNPNELYEALRDLSEREINIFGNGPSLNEIPDYLNFNGISIGMNRIDSFLLKKNHKLDIYIFVTDNIANAQWGDEWLSSLHECAALSKHIIISNEVFTYLKNNQNNEMIKGLLGKNLIVLNC